MASLWAKGQPELYEGIPWRVEWELLAIDFVFLIAMKYVSVDDDRVEDIVCKDFLLSQYDERARITARKALRSPNIRCLIIMDGLDEWPKNKLPSTVNLKNCQVLFTSRESRIATLNLKYEQTDRLGKLQSFRQEDIEQLVPIILQNFLKLTEDSIEYSIKVEEIVDKLRSPNLQHIARKPFSATYLVILLDKNPQACDSVTSLYLEVIHILIQRAATENRLSSTTESGLGKPLKRKQSLQMQSFKDNHLNALLQIGSYAFEILLTEMKKPVLQALARNEPLDEYVANFGIETGILRKSFIPETTRSNRKYDFLHRSILEYLAAMFLVHDHSSDKFRALLQSFSCVDDMLHTELFCTFVAGLDPKWGEKFQQHLTRLSKTYTYDEQTGFSFHHNMRPRKKTTYDLFCNLFFETSYGELSSWTPVTRRFPLDIYIDEDTDERIRHVTFTILEKLKDNVSSVFIENSPEDENVSFENALDKFLAHQLYRHLSTSFQHLYIRRLHLKSSQLPSLTTIVLRDVHIGDETNVSLTNSIESNPNLKTLRLSRIVCRGHNNLLHLKFHKSAILESLTLETIDLTPSSYVNIQSIVQVSKSLKILRFAGLNESSILSERNVFDFKLENKTGLAELYLQDIKLDPIALQYHGGFLAKNVNLTEIHLDKITYGKGDLVISSKNYLRTLHLAEVELSKTSTENLSLIIQETPGLEVLLLDTITCENAMLELDVSRKEHLRSLYMSKVNVRNMRLFENMYALRNVVLIDIVMNEQDWNSFLNDLSAIQHIIDVDLNSVNISEEYIQYITDSGNFILHGRPTQPSPNRHNISFTTTLYDSEEDY